MVIRPAKNQTKGRISFRPVALSICANCVQTTTNEGLKVLTFVFHCGKNLPFYILKKKLIQLIKGLANTQIEV